METQAPRQDASPADKPSAPLRAPLIAQRPAINARSIALGLAGVLLIAALTPFNDYALNNTFLIGSNLPLGLVVLLVGFVVLINGPLSRMRSRHAFSSGEIAVAVAMVLAGCAVPSSGLMRYLPASLVAPWVTASSDGSYLRLLESMNLPRWMFPAMEGDRPRDWIISQVIWGYYIRWDTSSGPIPFAAWLVPAAMWGIFLVALWGAIMCLMTLVRAQWVDNERLPFPLAQIQLQIIEAPPRGRWFNDLLKRPSLWVGCGLVFALRFWNGLAEYHPTYFPTIPLGFDLRSVLADPPFVYALDQLYQARIYFIAIGVTYFLSSSVAFSLFFFFLLQQVAMMMLGTFRGDGTYAGSWDQHTGAVLALGVSILWIGRRHWRLVIAQALRGERPGETRGVYLSYRLAFWGAAVCAVTMALWLLAAGMTLLGAGVSVALLLTLFVVIARIIAETGLPYGQLLVPMYQPWQVAMAHGAGQIVPVKTFFLTALLQTNFYDMREPFSVFASHGLKISDSVVMTPQPQRRIGRRIVGLLMLSVILAYVVSFASMLWTNYSYAATLDETGEAPVNLWGTYWAQRIYVHEPTTAYAAQAEVAHSPLAHISAGFVITAVLTWLRLTFTWWPLHPIGYLMMPTTPIQLMWFSLMLGWLIKAVMLRFGGATLYQNARPFFVGLILGDCLTAGVWLIVAMVLAGGGYTYHAISVMPQ